MTHFGTQSADGKQSVIGNLHQLFVCNLDDCEWNEVARMRLCTILAEHFESFTLQLADGYFRSQPAQTLIVTIGTDDTSSVIAAGHQLRCEFRQEGVGLAYDGVYRRLIAGSDGS